MRGKPGRSVLVRIVTKLYKISNLYKIEGIKLKERGNLKYFEICLRMDKYFTSNCDVFL